MRYDKYIQLNVRKLCVINAINDDGEKIFCTIAVLDPNSSNEEILSMLLKNSPEIEKIWASGRLDIEYKNANVSSCWGYLPESQEELNEFKKYNYLH